LIPPVADLFILEPVATTPEQSSEKQGFTYPISMRVVEAMQVDESPPPSSSAGLDQGRHPSSSKAEPATIGASARLLVHGRLGPSNSHVAPSHSPTACKALRAFDEGLPKAVDVSCTPASPVPKAAPQLWPGDGRCRTGVEKDPPGSSSQDSRVKEEAQGMFHGSSPMGHVGPEEFQEARAIKGVGCASPGRAHQESSATGISFLREAKADAATGQESQGELGENLAGP
jgi:hypothetical protein